MFVLDEKEETGREFWWPVTVKKPVDGGYRSHEFQVKFMMLSQDRIDELLEGTPSADDDEAGIPDEVEDRFSNALLVEVIRDWKDVYVIEDGEKVAAKLESATLERFLNVPYWRVAVIQAYFKIIAGGAERTKRRRKN